MTYHVRHVGNQALTDELLQAGWTLLGEYAPLSPVITYAAWLRCPEACCPTTLDGLLQKLGQRIAARLRRGEKV